MPTIVPVQFVPPRGLAEIKKVYGDFKYTELSRGEVDIDDTWERDNLVVLRNVCNTGLKIQLHYKVAPIFEACLTEAIKRCPQYRIRMLGGHSARHMMHNPKRALSLHSWGCAFDVNWDTNPVSSSLVTDIPTNWRLAFTEQGWAWGGNWDDVKDSMHFEYGSY